MFGRGDLKELREALDACGCDMNAFKHWQRSYEKLMKQLPSVCVQYEDALRTTQEVYETAQELEDLMVSGRSDIRRDFAGLLKTMKKVQNTFDHEFIVSSTDREFHSTYASVLKLGVKALEDGQQRLILQSELENLLELLKENLGKEEPRLAALCFFYQEHTDGELENVPPSGRVERIVQVYEEEFVRPIAQMLLSCIPYADSRREALAPGGRREQREARQLELLWNRPGENRTERERAERILRELMERGETE